MDNFYEQLVTTFKTTKYKMANSGVYVFLVLGFLAMILGSVIPSLLLLALSGGLFILKKKLFVEYEYEFTNGDIDIDKILEMKKRTRVISFNIKEVELIAPENSTYVKDFSNKPEKVLNFYPSTANTQIYVAMVTGGNERVQIRFVPDEKFLNLCYKYNPRAIKRS
ncbi:DUF6106 family protein [Clostridium omnivorum]|uniref:Uncharacterized protein n=1 Tax=Clostridium omnivorum TaxID=1604902 RepID=A0ABQ5N234_9CLOT|nr:DUF6106 family protein [Clostridium sp. E14]GLC29263.1 hypothetical protein bsdE14_06730 [Clostridium sp. E14]